MKRRKLSPLFFTLTSLLLLGSLAGSSRVTTAEQGTSFVAKGSIMVSGPVEATRRTKTAAGYRFVGGSETEKIQLVNLDFDASLRGRKLDPKSREIRKVVQDAIESRSWVVEDNSLQVERNVRALARRRGVAVERVAQPDVTLAARSTIKEETVSFNFAGRGKMKFRPLPEQARERKLVPGDEGEGEGLIRNFRTTSEELRSLNGSNIRIKIKFHIDQVDASGVARGRLDFDLRSEK
jgi:hypothetical protein